MSPRPTTPAAPVVARTVEQHLAAVLDGAVPPAAVDLPVPEAVGLVLAGDVTATVDLPGFDNSAMDGYAVRLADLVGDGPWRLPVRDDVPAGDEPHRPLDAGAVARVMTGAPVPEGTEAVIPVEWTDAGTHGVRLDRRPEAAANIRRRGEDVAAGQVVLDAGTVVTPAVVGLLSGVGRAVVPVYPRPRVLVLSTGAELVPAGSPLGPAQIHDANGPMLAAAVRRAGGDAVTAPIVADRPGALLDALTAHLDRADLVLTSAGVSEGAYDVVKADLAQAGVQFARVAMQPGKPQGAGRIGPRGVPVVTLPGNPASAFVSFHVFVRPLLRRLLGLPDGPGPVLRAGLTEAVRSPAGRRQFLRARLSEDGRTVTPVGGPGSHLLGALARSDSLVVVPEDVTVLDAGATVDVLLTEGDPR